VSQEKGRKQPIPVTGSTRREQDYVTYIGYHQVTYIRHRLRISVTSHLYTDTYNHIVGRKKEIR